MATTANITPVTGTDYYALFQSLEPHLWEIILDVLLLEATDAGEFRHAFYPILETFPEICDRRSPIKSYWARTLNRINPPLESHFTNPYTDCYPQTIEFIEEDAEGFVDAMAVRRGVIGKRVRFPQFNPKHHTKSRNDGPRPPSLTTSNKRCKW